MEHLSTTRPCFPPRAALLKGLAHALVASDTRLIVVRELLADEALRDELLRALQMRPGRVEVQLALQDGSNRCGLVALALLQLS